MVMNFGLRVGKGINCHIKRGIGNVERFDVGQGVEEGNFYKKTKNHILFVREGALRICRIKASEL